MKAFERVFDLHDQGERARRDGRYAEAVRLFTEAAFCALTLGGRKVLVEKAKDAQLAGRQLQERPH